MGRVLNTLPDLPDSRQSVVLDNETFVLRFRWHERVYRWYFSMWDENGEPVVLGRPLQAGTLPLSNHAISNGPKGELVVTGPSDYKREDFGDSLRVVYFPAEELESLFSPPQRSVVVI